MRAERTLKVRTDLFLVKVDLAMLSTSELLQLQSGVASAIEAQRRNDISSRCWTVPDDALETVELKLDDE